MPEEDMTDLGQTVMQAVSKISFNKEMNGKHPVHALDIEVSRMTGLGLREVEAEAARLETEGLIRIGRGLNYNYYKFTMKMFEKAIKAFLDDKAEKDEAFAKKYKSEKKNITDCCKFIIAEVKKSCKGKEAACTDEYVYGLAIHYYDEADLKVTGSTSAHVVVSRQLTEAEKEEARKEAEIQYMKEKEDAVKRAKEEEVRKNLERLRKEEAKAEAAEKRKAAAIEKKKQQIQQETCLFLFDDGEDQA